MTKQQKAARATLLDTVPPPRSNLAFYWRDMGATRTPPTSMQIAVARPTRSEALPAYVQYLL